MDINECFKILGLDSSASFDDIKKAYYREAKKYHPDTTPFDKIYAEEKFKQINLAYSILKKKFSSKISSTEGSSNSGFNSDSNSDSNSDIFIFKSKRLFNICDKYLNILDSKIIKDKNFMSANHIICVSILNDFYSDTASDFLFLNEYGLMVGPMADVYCSTLYEFVDCLIWSNEPDEALKVLKFIKGILPSSSPIYKNADSLQKKIISTLNDIDKKSHIINVSNSLSFKQIFNRFFIFLISILCFILFVYSLYPYSDRRSSVANKSGTYSRNSAPFVSSENIQKDVKTSLSSVKKSQKDSKELLPVEKGARSLAYDDMKDLNSARYLSEPIVPQLSDKKTGFDFIFCISTSDGDYFLDLNSIELVNGPSADPVIHYVVEGRTKGKNNIFHIWRAERFFETRIKQLVDGSNYSGTLDSRGNYSLKPFYVFPSKDLCNLNWKNRIVYSPDNVESTVLALVLYNVKSGFYKDKRVSP